MVELGTRACLSPNGIIAQSSISGGDTDLPKILSFESYEGDKVKR